MAYFPINPLVPGSYVSLPGIPNSLLSNSSLSNYLLSSNPLYPYSTYITSQSNMANIIVPSYSNDGGLNSNYLAQKQVTEYLTKRILDKWLYSDRLCDTLKYLKVTNGQVNIVQSVNEYKNNKICSDNNKEVDLKVDYIEDNFFNVSVMRKILIKMINELGYKWCDFPINEETVVQIAGKYLKKKLKKRIPDANN